MENQEKQHKRRVRYSGTHPKSYKEKYKEHNPEKYADTIERVIQKGGTPAGMHSLGIIVPEAIILLSIFSYWTTYTSTGTLAPPADDFAPPFTGALFSLGKR